MKDKLTPKVVAALGAAALAAVALIGWFGLVSPQRSKAADLDQQIADAQTQLVVFKATAHPARRHRLPSALVLTRAMPREVAMPQVLRQLLRAANRADVRLDSVTPQAATAAVRLRDGADGRRRHRALLPDPAVPASTAHADASSSAHAVQSSGRLFSVDTVSLAAGEDQLPQLAATIHLNVFTYSGSAAAATSTATPTTAPDSSTSTSAVAAGGTP